MPAFVNALLGMLADRSGANALMEEGRAVCVNRSRHFIYLF